jgi:uncharacterized protein (TIGR00159 family)
MTGWFPFSGLDLLDIALVAVFVWFAIRYFRQTRAKPALAGLTLLGVVYLFARGLELRLTATLFQGFFAVVVLVLVVVFQEDLRRVFEQLGSWWRGRERVPAEHQSLDVLVRAVARLASTRTGALIVLPGSEPIERHVEGGVPMGGRLSEPLLLSLFDASSPGHDGAVILRGPEIERFAAHLPLSANHAALGPGGTRHAAALGLAERCDATCIVVSEERGTVSIARGGAIRVLSHPEELVVELSDTSGTGDPTEPWWRGRVGMDTALAVLAALALWAVFVPGSDVQRITLSVPVEVLNLPADHALEKVEPERVEVTLSGLRRDLFVANRGRVAVRVDGYLARLGRRTFQVDDAAVQKPSALTVVSVAPDRIRISIAKAAPGDAP